MDLQAFSIKVPVKSCSIGFGRQLEGSTDYDGEQ